MIHLSRRTALLGLTAAWTLGTTSFALADAPTEKRLVVVILRGALDGMAAVVPYGDPDLARLRSGLIPPEPGQPNGLLDLGGFYGLHPALEGMYDMYKAGQLLPVHAVAGPYRSRSHFDAQDYLESGADQRLSSGWLNRAVEAMPERKANTALSIGVTVPLMLRGAAPVGTYAPTGYQPLAPELYARIADLAHDDALLGPVITEGLKDRGFSHDMLLGLQQTGDKNAVANVAQAAGKLLANADGPRVAVVEAGGWDTHAGQLQRLVAPLKQLDIGLAALKKSMGPTWNETAVLIMTEFGRTARMNGTNGTDHGTAGVAFLAGGAIQGGRIAGTWPGLKDTQLFENRDLAPTTDVRSLAIALLVNHLGVPASAMPTVFPGSNGITAPGGILRV
jgi:uncharacterized protein (DUF1501 family)